MKTSTRNRTLGDGCGEGEESLGGNCSKDEKGNTSHSVLFLFRSLRIVVTVDQTQKLSVPCRSEDRNDPQQQQQDKDLEEGCAKDRERMGVKRCQAPPLRLKAPLGIRTGEPPPELGWGWEGAAEGRSRRLKPVAPDWFVYSRSVTGLGDLQREML